MKKEDLRIVYMGTPEFAVECLRALVEHGYQVVGVVTMPDKPMGRHGSVLQSSAVKKYAESVGLPILQPEKLKDEAFLEALRAWNADCRSLLPFVCFLKLCGTCLVWARLICMLLYCLGIGVLLLLIGQLSMAIQRQV